VAKDVEKFEPTADLQPMFGPTPYAGNPSYTSDVPDWMVVEPPYGPTDGMKDTIDRYWSYTARWPRYVALGFMWVTHSFWRFLYVVGTVVLVILLIVNK
jgi:hypothetical protein